MTLIEFSDIIDKDIVIRRYSNQNNRTIVYFEHCEIKDGPCLTGVHGNGTTIESSVNDYINKIRGGTIVFNAMHSNRQEFKVPSNLNKLY